MIVIKISGENGWKIFKHESGGHRIQRRPNNAKDRMHSSTVTVAVFKEPLVTEYTLNLGDCEITTCRGSGPGGQLRNKTDSAVQIKHKPTKLFVRCETERSQQQNKATAIALLSAKLRNIQDTEVKDKLDNNRKSQIGSGERSDKIRTMQFQNGQVINHLNGKKVSIERYLKGDIVSLQ